MKLQNTIFASALAVLALSSCSKDNKFDGRVEPTNAIEFTSSIAGSDAETRLDGTTWAGGEELGVFMLDASTSAFSISDNGANKVYTGQADGSLAAKGGALAFPSDKSEVRFVAYYPYQKSADTGMYTIDLTKEGDNDLLFSSTPTPYNLLSEGKVNLSFSHKLSKLQLTLTNDISGEAVDPSKVSMRAEMRTAGTFSLRTQGGELAIGDAVNEVSLPVADVSGKAVGSVIVFPTVQQSNGTSTSTLNSVSKLIFTVDGKEYICDNAEMLQSLVANNQYNFDVSLADDAKAVVALTSTIQGWSVVDKGDLIAIPTDGGDSGDDGDDDGDDDQNLGNVTEARALIGDTETVISQDFTLRGSVISTSQAVGGFTVVISDGKAGILLYGADASGLAVGDEVTVPLKGATAKTYSGLKELVAQKDGPYQFVFTKVGTRAIDPIKVTNVAELPNYVSMLVTLDNVSVKSGQAATTWAGITEEGKDYPNGKVQLMVGGTELLAKHYYKAPFYNDALPTGTGTVTGVVGYYKDAAQIAFRSTADFAGMSGTGGNTGGDTGGDTGGGDTGGDTGGETPADVVTFPVKFDFVADASNGTGIYPATGANSNATIKTYGAEAFTYTAGSNGYPGYIVAKGFTADSGWDFTLPVSNLAAGATVNFVGTMRSSNTAPGNYVIEYSVDGGTNFVTTSTTVALAGSKDYHKINTDITIAEGLSSGNLIIRFAVSGTLCAGRVADSTYATENFTATGTNRWADGAVTISLK